ncbi:restriction endonuclease subunit S [Enterococcus faecium]|uniref:restriction endonuclease subunit S n=1 Tax=Enterococcus faecium TaxID=1352 RepID=UPI001157C2AA|nr:restriction endonuclease subunit S [Enterococcus faecium]EMF0455677.1 restriction endonuclease subunit S [Enterococcus hirae]MDT6543213.1 restriction endonuclease subunit S [Enterococcus faecium]
MSNETRPEIRFPEFTDEWEQVKLKDVATVFDGTHQTPKYTESGVKFVSVENIKTLETEKYISQEAYDSEYSKKQAEKGDVLMTRIGDIGTAKVIETDEPLAYYVTLALLKPNEIDSSFLAWLISSPEVQRNIWKRTLHIAFPKKINLGEINQIEMNVPSLEEQTKIGTFFKQIDNTITLHQRKLDLLKETKKGFLQKMFPKNGAKVPEIRFSGFTEDWEQRRLSDVASIVGGGTPSTSNPEYWDGDIDWYAPAEIGDQIYVSKSLKTITELGQQKSSAKILPIGTVLFTSRAGIGNTAILAKEGTTNQGFQSIVPHKNKLDSYFIFSRTHELKRYGEVTGAGSTFAEVSGKQMAKMPILIPCINEQRKIGAFFEQLDTTITLHQRELDVLKETKKGFLQKMFV